MIFIFVSLVLELVASIRNLDIKTNDLQVSTHKILSQLPQSISHVVITPSQASASREPAYRILLEGLSLNIPVSGPGVMSDEGDFSGFKFPFTWRSRPESSSYDPFCKAFNLFRTESIDFSVAITVSNGEHLLNSLLYETGIWSLRQYDVFNKKAGSVQFKGTVKGRTDIVVLCARLPLPVGTILRHQVGFVIEVKKTAEMIGVKLNSAFREATFQLIGLCGQNAVRTPCVVLTDFVKHYFVVYLSRTTVIPLKYEIVVQRCSSIAAALNLAVQISTRECVSADFGRPDTPVDSLI